MSCITLRACFIEKVSVLHEFYKNGWDTYTSWYQIISTVVHTIFNMVQYDSILKLQLILVLQSSVLQIFNKVYICSYVGYLRFKTREFRSRVEYDFNI